jgi:hypothetical protein
MRELLGHGVRKNHCRNIVLELCLFNDGELDDENTDILKESLP